MFLKSLKLKGILSFRDTELDLRPLNVLIGPNGSGKSNLIEVIGLLQALPTNLAEAIRRGGGVQDWLWRGDSANEGGAEIETTFEDERLGGEMSLRYALRFLRLNQELVITHERLENERPLPGHAEPFKYLDIANRHGFIWIRSPEGRSTTRIEPDDVAPGQSVLRDFRDPKQYRQITSFAKRLERVRLYRDLDLGPSMRGKGYQTSDRPSDFLEEDAANLALILNRMEFDGSRAKVEQQLRRFYETTEGLSIQSEALSLRLFLKERGLQGLTPVNRLSDGTVRYLCLLAILCHPDPPPLICIEEPEIGLHPDILRDVALLLLEASERTQLIVTTHSDILIDALSGDPESVVVCERDFDAGTTFRRLSAKKLNLWLEEFSLGELWRTGELGGVRW